MKHRHAPTHREGLNRQGRDNSIICRLAVGLTVAVLATGCGGSNETRTPRSLGGTSDEERVKTRSEEIASAPKPTTQSGEAMTAAPMQEIAGLSNGLAAAPWQSEFDRIDPVADGWRSEAFSEAALKQLDRLFAAAAQSPYAVEITNEILTPDFSTGLLRPEPLKSVYRDAAIEVSRANTFLNERARYRGADGLRQAWRDLAAQKGGGEPPHVEFKLVRVQSSDESLGGREITETQVRFHLSRQTATGRLQQNASWKCLWEDSGPRPRLSSISVEDFEEVRTSSPRPMFADCTSAVMQNQESFGRQLAFGMDHWRDRLDWRFGWEVVGPHGIAVGDVNNDGLDDLFVCETGGVPNRLFVQQPDGSAKDISAESGVDYLEPTHSALLVDLDGDGDQDLVFASLSYLLAMENDGQGRFVRRLIDHNHRSLIRSLAAADFDNDGRLDIFVCGYSSRDAHIDMVGLGRPLPYHDANNGAPNFLLRNVADWQLQDVTKQVGLDANNRRFSYAASWEDYDNDGDLDLYVANDFGRNNLFQNSGGRFKDVAAEAGVEDVAAGMSVTWGDYNQDGWVDLYVGNMFSSAGNRIAYQRQFKSTDDQSVRALYQRHARGNSLFENAGDGTFRDVSQQAAVNEGKWAWSSNFVDLNNDGWDDLVVANGMVTGDGGPGDL